MSEINGSNLPPDDETSQAAVRRRRSRRIAFPASSEEHAAFLEELAHRVTPSFDFFLFSLLSGLALVVAILVDAPAFYVLTALLAPFMGPVAGLAFSTVLGSGRFFARMTGALLTGSLFLLLWGALAGWLARLIPNLTFEQVLYHARFSWPDVVLLLLGAGLTAYTLVRWPEQRPLVTSVALAYEIYLPVGVAGFGLGSGMPGVWIPALQVYLLHVALAALAGALVLVATGLRPRRTAWLAAAALVGVAAVMLALLFLRASAQPAAPLNLAQTPTASAAAAEATRTPAADASQTPAATSGAAVFTATLAASDTPQPPAATRTPTNTLIPTRTPTITTTPIPTPVWAIVSSDEGGGVIVHETPGFNTPYVASLINGVLVVVLSDAVYTDGVTWVHIRTPDGREGWVVRDLLTTATPAPEW